MSCQCQDAATRAYRELKARDYLDGDAFVAAVTIFHQYHPDRSRLEALETVADWLDQAEAPPETAVASAGI